MVEIREITGSQAWPLRKKVMYPEYSIDFVKLPDDHNGTHFGLYYNNELVSVVSLFIEEGVAQFRKLATDFDYQQKGYASMLLRHVFDFVLIRDVKQIWCNARKDKISFYKKFNMIVTHKEFQRDGVEYVILKKAL